MKIAIILTILIVATGMQAWADYAPRQLRVEMANAKRISLDILTPNVTTEHAMQLARLADRSTATRDPQNIAADGWMRGPDLVIITEKLLIWVCFSGNIEGLTNGGGGFVRGVWPLTRTDGELTFKNTVNEHDWAPNEFLPGSGGERRVQGSGTSFLMSVGDLNNDTLNTTLITAEISGKRMFDVSAQPVQNGEAYHYSCQSYMRHGLQKLDVLAKAGFSSIYDANSDPNQECRLRYKLDYIIPVDRPYFEHTLTITPEGAPAGPISTYVMSHNSPGSNGYQHKYIRANTKTIQFRKGADIIPSNEIISIDWHDGFTFWINAERGTPGTLWEFFENKDLSGRYFALERTDGHETPDFIQAIRNDYSSQGSWVNAYDLQYTDINQGGGNVYWPEGRPLILGNRVHFGQPDK